MADGAGSDLDLSIARGKVWSELQTIYNEAPVGLAVIGTDFRFQRLNARFAEINGVPVEAHIGRTIREVVPALADLGEELVRRIVQLGEPIRNIEVTGETPSQPGVTRNFIEHWSPLKCPAGNVMAVNVVIEDVTAQKEAERRLIESERRLVTALRLGKLGVFEHAFKPGGRYYWDETYRDIWGVPKTAVITDETFWGGLHPDDIDHIKELTESFHSPSAPQHHDFVHRIIRASDGEIRWVAVYLCVVRDLGGVAKLVGTIQDITERKDASDRDRMLVREVNHRSKNLLAVVQAIATQTLRKSEPDHFVRNFAERLRSLSASHDLVVLNGWQGVDFRDLISSQLAHFQDLIGRRIHVSGPDLLLSATAAQDLGMALHELATNAAKYGALSSAEGAVSIVWSIQKEAHSEWFTLKWFEHGGPAIAKPTRTGFGTLVTTRVLENSLRGKVSVSYETTGLRWSLRTEVTALTPAISS